MPCHESSLMILTAPHKPGRMDTAERDLMLIEEEKK